MIRRYPELTEDEVARQGRAFVLCDHQDFEAAVYEGARYVTDENVGEPRPDRDERWPEADRVWKAEDVGVQYDRGTLVTEAVEGEACGASAEVQVSEREYTEGPRRIIEPFAPLPEGWASTSDNALDGAADFCPKHADRIHVVPDSAEIPPPVTEG